jgi:hypothetical protein
MFTLEKQSWTQHNWNEVRSGELAVQMAGIVVEIDTREFHGDRNLLARFLNEKLRVEIHVERGKIRIAENERPGAALSLQDLKDLVKRGLHHMRESGCHVTIQKGIVVIRKEKGREHHARTKSSVPTVQQTVPYFFLGS